MARPEQNLLVSGCRECPSSYRRLPTGRESPGWLKLEDGPPRSLLRVFAARRSKLRCQSKCFASRPSMGRLATGGSTARTVRCSSTKYSPHRTATPPRQPKTRTHASSTLPPPLRGRSEPSRTESYRLVEVIATWLARRHRRRLRCCTTFQFVERRLILYSVNRDALGLCTSWNCQPFELRGMPSVHPAPLVGHAGSHPSEMLENRPVRLWERIGYWLVSSADQEKDFGQAGTAGRYSLYRPPQHLLLRYLRIHRDGPARHSLCPCPGLVELELTSAQSWPRWTRRPRPQKRRSVCGSRERTRIPTAAIRPRLPYDHARQFHRVASKSSALPKPNAPPIFARFHGVNSATRNRPPRQGILSCRSAPTTSTSVSTSSVGLKRSKGRNSTCSQP